jgi:uncharacterized protein YjbJ (UPF0337 family)
MLRAREARKEKAMSQDIFKGQWKEIKGRLKEWWGDLTEDDVNRVDGNQEKLVGILQQKYGYAKDRAMQEVSSRLDQFGKRDKV